MVMHILPKISNVGLLWLSHENPVLETHKTYQFMHWLSNVILRYDNKSHVGKYDYATLDNFAQKSANPLQWMPCGIYDWDNFA